MILNHSQDEDRFILLGMSAYFRLLVVCHCYRKNDKIIRIISARKANKLEQKQYQGELNMRDNYDFSNAVKNPYSQQLKTQITIDLEQDIIKYFEEKAQEKGISSVTLINLYLRDCVENNRQLPLELVS